MDLHSIANTSTAHAARASPLDSVRVPLHQWDHEIRVFTRHVQQVTGSVPERVVEVVFNEPPRSKPNPGGVAWRLARVERHRQDKTALQADTRQTVRQIAESGLRGAAA